ncbi:hypothetical protein Tco_1085272 [Tanacetum coccineum]
MLVEKNSDSKKHDRQIPIGQKFSLNKSSDVYLKTTPPKSGLTWKPTGKIFTQVGLKWIPIGKSVETCYNTNDSASPLAKKTYNPNTTICANSSSLSAGVEELKRNVWIKGVKKEALHTLYAETRTFRVMLFSTHSDEWKSFQSHHQIALRFQEDEKYEHVGQDTRSQDGKDDKDLKDEDLKISELESK